MRDILATQQRSAEMEGNTNGSSDAHHHHHHNDDITPAALLEQLVYVDTFMPDIDDPSQLDERLTAELSAFADDSFIFPDEDKPKTENDRDNRQALDHHTSNLMFNLSHNSYGSNGNNNQNSNVHNSASGLGLNAFAGGINSMLPLSSLSNAASPTNLAHQSAIPNNTSSDLLSTLPKVHVPPGAQSSLIAAGLSQTQIDALAALIAQHQGSKPGTPDQNPVGTFSASSHLSSLSNFQLSPDSSVNPSTTSFRGDSSSGHRRGSSQSQDRRDSFDMELADVKIEPTGDVEVDKRRRNTAASARFRIKKKLKEQQLERSVRELTELTMTLEKKIQTLEMENRLLRNLVVEKGEQRNNSELELLKQRARLASDNDFMNQNSQPRRFDKEN